MPLPGGLSMLWETLDPREALQQRFGFGRLSEAGDWLAPVLDTRWRIGLTKITRMAISAHNAIIWAHTTRGPVVIKWSADEAAFGTLRAATRLLRQLGDRGLPVAAPLITVHDTERIVLDGPGGPLSVAVLPELTGGWLDVTDPAAVQAAGAALARLHDEFRDYPPDGFTAAPRVRATSTALGRWLADHDHHRLPAASRRIERLLVDLPPLDGSPQLVHGDFRSANILTEDSKIIGVLDFDDVALGRPVGDLAQAGVYLGTRFTDWSPTSPAVQRELRAGYESVRPLSPVEKRWYEIIVLWLSLCAVPAGDDPHGWADAVTELLG